MIKEWEEYASADFRIFGLYGVGKDGRCECGNPSCEAIYKHPRLSRWQSVPNWSSEQLETFSDMGHFDTGFGALCHGWLIIDIDARNGGVESYARLVDTVPEIAGCGYIVETGSGGGSKHLYFRLRESIALLQQIKGLSGIDLKSTGYIVCAGSMHASGNKYKALVGSPYDITDAPQALIDLLRKPDRHRISMDGVDIDVSEKDIAEMLSHIDPDCCFDEWIKTGMAVHHCTGGTGLHLWSDWTSCAKQQDHQHRLAAGNIEKRWHSFGKSSNPVGYGTLLHYAREGGYVESVTFEYVQQDDPIYDDQRPECDIDISAIDIRRPPGFVGELAKWIDDQCLYPVENLAVAASLCAVSSLAGMRHVDEFNDMTCNLIAFCVAGSSRGKESVNQAYLKIMRTAGVQAAVHGGIKSEQELMRNLIRHQAAFYSIDEFGHTLRKLDNAVKRGGAAYLEGVVGAIMSVYSKANGYLPVTGDLKDEIKETITKELSRAEKQLDDLPADSSWSSKRQKIESTINRLCLALEKINDGIDSPYLTMIGYTTPEIFANLMGFEQATNGFMGRALIFEELQTNPRRKNGFSKRQMTDRMANALRNLYAPGVFDMMGSDRRIEYTGDKQPIPSDPGAKALLDDVYESFHSVAELHKEKTGMEAIARRGYEATAKVSLVLAIPSGVRTTEHVRWAYAISKSDVERKIRMAYATDRPKEVKGIEARVLSMLDGDHGETLGVMSNRIRKIPKSQVEEILKQMVDKGMLKIVKSIHPRSKQEIIRYFSKH